MLNGNNQIKRGVTMRENLNIQGKWALRQKLLPLIICTLVAVLAAPEVAAEEIGFRLQMVGHLEGVGDCRSLAISGDLVYLGTIDQGLKIVDISQPSQSTVIHTEPAIGRISDIRPSGTLILYTSGRSSPREGWFYILDASNPSNPTLLAQYETRDIAAGLDVWDNIAFIGDDDADLTVLDISNLSSPVQIDTYHIWNLEKVGISNDGTIAAVTEGSVGSHRIHLFDITNPASVSVITSINNAFSGDTIFVGDTAYFTGLSNGALIYDLSTPSSPVSLGSVSAAASSGLALDGSYLYVANSEEGINVFDISDLGSIY
jgi:hypothetical protein